VANAPADGSPAAPNISEIATRDRGVSGCVSVCVALVDACVGPMNARARALARPM
jgi:hypothetical protein